MRKWIKLPLIAVLLGAAFALTGCGKDKQPYAYTGEPEMLFDFSDGGMRWDDTIEFELEEFPEIKFIWSSSNLAYVENPENGNDKQCFIFSGMPIWSVYFCDLNGDGKREIISGISVGSGIIDDRIIVYDHANSKLYTIEDRFNYDFAPLINEDRVMCYSKVKTYSYPDPPGEPVIEPLTMKVLTEKTDNSIW